MIEFLPFIDHPSSAWPPCGRAKRCAGAACSNFANATGSPIAANSTTFQSTSLAPDTTYSFRVRATAAGGSTDWLTGSAITTGPAAPTALVIGTTTTSTVELSWTDNATNETAYEIERCMGAGCTTFSAIAGSPFAADKVTHVITGLAGGTTYRARVRAVKNSATSAWLTTGDVTTKAEAASCASPTTVVVDSGSKSNSTNSGRGLWSDTKVIPGTRRPAIAYYDGSATGGTASIKISWWNGTAFQVESVAGDMRVAAGSATYVRLAFLSNGRPMVFWTTGGTTVKGAMRSAALTSDGTWTAAVLDTVAGAASRALEVAVSPADHVGLVYLTNTTTAGRARFISCAANCASIASFVSMTSGTDTIEASNVIAATQATGVAWCKHDANTYYPAVTYPGNAGASIRYASCLNADLTACKTVAGWSGQTTTVVNTAGVMSKLFIDGSVVGDAPKILTRNAGNTLLQAFQMNQACNASPAYTFTTGNTFGAATSGNIWATLLKDSSGYWHVAANLGTTAVNYHNSTATNFGSTTWNAAGTVNTVTLPAASAGAGGADINNTDRQISISYGNAAAPFNINLGVVSDYAIASSSASAVFYSLIPDLTGGINLPLSTGQTRNVSSASTSAGYPAIAYIDTSVGTAAGSTLKYAYRNGGSATDTWARVSIPNTSTPMFPSLAFDHANKPWIAYYDSGTVRYNLITNSASDGSGTWSFYQFPINAKTATATAPATDDTALAMHYAGGIASPVMLVLNSTAAGGTGVRAGYFNPSAGAFTSIATLDSLGASFATRLTADHDRNGNIVVAYYDLTSTRAEFSYSTNGVTWLGTPTQVSAAGTGREGLAVKLSPSGYPAMSYYDRANNTVHFATCQDTLSACATAGNWTVSAAASSVGVSGIATANEHVLNTALMFDGDESAYIAYLEGAAAATPRLAMTTNASGSFATTTLVAAPTAGITGASAANSAIAGFNVSSYLSESGDFMHAYIGPNNWLYATSCGD